MTKHVGRPIGSRIHEILEITEAMGTSTTKKLRERMAGEVASSNVGKLCSRAAGMGLLLVNRNFQPISYTVTPGWRDIVSQRSAKPEAQEKPVEQAEPLGIVAAAMRSQPNSVFAMGARA